KLEKAGNRFWLALLPTPAGILHSDRLSPAELHFIRTLNKYLFDHPELFPFPSGSLSPSPVRAAMVPSRSPYPVILLSPGKGKPGEDPELPVCCLVRRDNPLVRGAVKAVQADPENIEIFVPLLF
ncbi:MAG: hypothetical protein GY940_40090, partial [bacterium]|nr:hypothetical protein [bacterium]